jgi:hypothetical protein
MKLRPLLDEELYLLQLMTEVTLDRIIHQKKQMVVQRKIKSKEHTGVEFIVYVLTAGLVRSLQLSCALLWLKSSTFVS